MDDNPRASCDDWQHTLSKNEKLLPEMCYSSDHRRLKQDDLIKLLSLQSYGLLIVLYKQNRAGKNHRPSPYLEFCFWDTRRKQSYEHQEHPFIQTLRESAGIILYINEIESDELPISLQSHRLYCISLKPRVPQEINLLQFVEAQAIAHLSKSWQTVLPIPRISEKEWRELVNMNDIYLKRLYEGRPSISLFEYDCFERPVALTEDDFTKLSILQSHGLVMTRFMVPSKEATRIPPIIEFLFHDDREEGEREKALLHPFIHGLLTDKVLSVRVTTTDALLYFSKSILSTTNDEEWKPSAETCPEGETLKDRCVDTIPAIEYQDVYLISMTLNISEDEFIHTDDEQFMHLMTKQCLFKKIEDHATATGMRKTSKKPWPEKASPSPRPSPFRITLSGEFEGYKFSELLNLIEARGWEYCRLDPTHVICSDPHEDTEVIKYATNLSIPFIKIAWLEHCTALKWDLDPKDYIWQDKKKPMDSLPRVSEYLRHKETKSPYELLGGITWSSRDHPSTATDTYGRPIGVDTKRLIPHAILLEIEGNLLPIVDTTLSGILQAIYDFCRQGEMLRVVRLHVITAESPYLWRFCPVRESTLEPFIELEPEEKYRPIRDFPSYTDHKCLEYAPKGRKELKLPWHDGSPSSVGKRLSRKFLDHPIMLKMQHGDETIAVPLINATVQEVLIVSLTYYATIDHENGEGVRREFDTIHCDDADEIVWVVSMKKARKGRKVTQNELANYQVGN